MAAPASSVPKISRLEHPSDDGIEENDLKNNLMKMMEVLQEEIKNSLKKLRKSQTKIGRNQ